MNEWLRKKLEKEAAADSAMFVVLPPEHETDPIRVRCRLCGDERLVGQADFHAQTHGYNTISIDNRELYRYLEKKTDGN